jgi:hypothetical protein
MRCWRRNSGNNLSDLALLIKLLMVTQDLISYVVESTAPFIVKECVQGDGEYR